jgi:hypothetical protein
LKFGVERSNRFAALKDLDVQVDIKNASEMIRGHIKISADDGLDHYELKKYKPGFKILREKETS